jgi:hypothetical protein
MVEFFRHKDGLPFYYTFYSGLLKNTYVEPDWKHLKDVYKDCGKLVRISEGHMGLRLDDYNFISLQAEYASRNHDKIHHSAIIGLRGIQKLMFKVYMELTPTSIRRIHFATREEGEAYFNYNFNTDFIKIDEIA